MNGLEVRKVVVFEVQTKAEVEASVSPVDDLEIPKLQEVDRCMSLQHKDKNILFTFVGYWWILSINWCMYLMYWKYMGGLFQSIDSSKMIYWCKVNSH